MNVESEGAVEDDDPNEITEEIPAVFDFLGDGGGNNNEFIDDGIEQDTEKFLQKQRKFLQE